MIILIKAKKRFGSNPSQSLDLKCPKKKFNAIKFKQTRNFTAHLMLDRHEYGWYSNGEIMTAISGHAAHTALQKLNV